MGRIIRHESEIGRWEMVLGLPPAALVPYVREYVGWFEHPLEPVCRRELPADVVPLIINFGAPITIVAASGESLELDSFSTGAFDRHVLVRTVGASGGVQINFTILGARLFFGRPLADLTNRTVPLEDILGQRAHTFVDRLRNSPTWEDRFAIADEELLASFSRDHQPGREIVWAFRRLARSHGRIPISTLVDEVGWSQKHFIDRFRDQLGLAPKTLARVLRFGRAADLIRQGSVTHFAGLAAACGYYDQAHFNRDVKEFAGVTPTELIRSLNPKVGGFVVNPADA